MLAKRKLRLWCLMGIFCTGCQTIPEPGPSAELPLVSALFESRPEIPSIESIHQLSSSEQVKFLAYYHDPSRATIAGHRRLYAYLDNITSRFDYDKDTVTAQQALERQEGDCLSLAILTTALAQLAEVPVSYQLIESDPVYAFTDKVVLKGVHLRTKLIDQNWRSDERVLWRPGTIVDYFPDGSEKFLANVSEQDYAARFYVNHAVKALQNGSRTNAFWYAREAVQVNPHSEDAINILALTYKQSGAFDLAEQAYKYALDLNPSALSVLRNYRNLLLEVQRPAEAKALEKRLFNSEIPNPYRWYIAGNESLAAGQPRMAKKHFEKALEIAPYVHQLHFGMAKAYYQIGDLEKTKWHLEQARQVTQRPPLQQLYSAKLAAL